LRHDDALLLCIDKACELLKLVKADRTRPTLADAQQERLPAEPPRRPMTQ
jgi:hypothetical protein